MPYGCFVNPFDDSKCCSYQQYNSFLGATIIQNSVHYLSCVHNIYIYVYSDASLVF